MLIILITLYLLNKYELDSFFPNNLNQFRLKLENKNKMNEIMVATLEKALDVWHRRLKHIFTLQHMIKIPKCLECKIVKMKRTPHKGELPEAKCWIPSNLISQAHSIRL